MACAAGDWVKWAVMRYFTPELYIRGNSPDDAVVHGVEEDWEQAIRRYNRRWNKIKSAFPDEVRRFDEDQICLHDAERLQMGQTGDRFVMVLQTEPPSCNLVILTFTLRGAPEVATEILPENLRGPVPYWLYEEFDLDRQKRCVFEVFFSNGWFIKLRFQDFQFLVAQRVVPAVNGQADDLAAAVSVPERS
jgi:Protein of unknown function (DUF4085)